MVLHGQARGEDVRVGGRPLRSLITIVMNVLIVVAVLLTLRVVGRYFGALGASEWGRIVVSAGGALALPFGVKDIHSAYSGVFDANAALTIMAVLVAEWVLSIVRDRV